MNPNQTVMSGKRAYLIESMEVDGIGIKSIHV